MSALYSRVDRGVWNSLDFRELSREARELWLYLLTCPSQNAFPGLFAVSLGTIAEDIDRTRDEVCAALAEIESRGMAKYDSKARVMWLPKAVLRRDDEAKSPNNVKGWGNAIKSIPSCELRSEAFATVRAFLEQLGNSQSTEALGDPLGYPSRRAPGGVGGGVGGGVVEGSVEGSASAQETTTKQQIHTPPGGLQEGLVEGLVEGSSKGRELGKDKERKGEQQQQQRAGAVVDDLVTALAKSDEMRHHPNVDLAGLAAMIRKQKQPPVPEMDAHWIAALPIVFDALERARVNGTLSSVAGLVGSTLRSINSPAMIRQALADRDKPRESRKANGRSVEIINGRELPDINDPTVPYWRPFPKMETEE
jgi:hypothetical protein